MASQNQANLIQNRDTPSRTLDVKLYDIPDTFDTGLSKQKMDIVLRKIYYIHKKNKKTHASLTSIIKMDY